eukprot:m.479242 g.479242  ORF g.479242 m.479242 type:complete len:291 (+) comp21377_c0_seq1:154-1026(+)
MVVLNVKRGDAQQFLYETTTDTSVADVTVEVARIFNGRNRIERLASAVEQLAQHGINLPPNMQGLTDDQISELKLVDEFSKACYPSGGTTQNPDPMGKRTGNAPTAKLAEVLVKTAGEAKEMVSQKQAAANIKLSLKTIDEAVERVRGAVMIVYPMGLPPHEDVDAILNDDEDLSGTQAAKEVVPEASAALWWANKELARSKKLSDYIGKNEKTKIVVKIQKSGSGAPSREPVFSEEQQKEMMAFAYRKQEEAKKLAETDEDAYLNSPWADSSSLKQSLHGTGSIGWRPR